jgi:hypothetical protein
MQSSPVVPWLPEAIIATYPGKPTVRRHLRGSDCHAIGLLITPLHYSCDYTIDHRLIFPTICR